MNSSSCNTEPVAMERSQAPRTSGEEKLTLFYRSESPFSQFHPAFFSGLPLFIRTEKDKEGYRFSHAEQYMMFNKAKLFNDEETAKLILHTKDPKCCKLLGRKVKNFDEGVWNAHNEEIVMQGNRLKFTQNPDLLAALMNTDGTTLVEASPTDKIYGIGLPDSDPRALNRNTWQGKNLLGEILTKLREEIKLKNLCTN